MPLTHLWPGIKFERDRSERVRLIEVSASTKIFLAAIILSLGAFVCVYIDQLPQESTSGFTLYDGNPDWSIWNYLSLVFLTCSVGLGIAGIKLRRSP